MGLLLILFHILYALYLLQGLGNWTCTKYNGWFLGPETDDHYECPSSQVLLGEYEFLDNGESNQKFDVQNPTTLAFPIVELRILSNHGEDWTCVYRFRVHGNITKPSAPTDTAPPSDTVNPPAAPLPATEKCAEQANTDEETIDDIPAEPDEPEVKAEARANLNAKMKVEQTIHVNVGAGAGAQTN